MEKQAFTFNSGIVDIYFDAGLIHLKDLADNNSTILITDENIYRHHQAGFSGWKTIVLNAGEKYKNQETVNAIIDQLIEYEADRKTTLVGIGGGVITDLTGYVASIYMRGVRFGFVPTSILGLVDASIGGKNGIDVGLYKNIVGVIKQPSFILHDYELLKSLPKTEWINGFAEIIKHGCIRDEALFRELEDHSLEDYYTDSRLLADLIKTNALLKIGVVQSDELENGERKHLNFGHTLGHAIENEYNLSHGEAISIGMSFAAKLSRQLLEFKDIERIINLIKRYQLPVDYKYENQKVIEVLKMDKKKNRSMIDFVLLKSIGKAVIYPLPVTDIESYL